MEPEKLSGIAQKAIGDPAAAIFVRGKLTGAEGLLLDLPSLLQQQGFQPLAVPLHHGVRAGAYPQPHRDPFDRLLAAQAELEGLQLVTIDPALATFPCRLLW